MSDRLLLLAAASLAVALSAPGACPAAPPQAEFTVDDGWVTVLVTRDGAPLKGTQLKVSDGIGLTVATGETGPEGRGEFPLPPAESFTVEITLGGKKADPIRLRRAESGLFPAEVQLTFGLAACCRVPSRGRSVGTERVPGREPGTDSTPEWPLAVVVAAVALAPPLIAVFFMIPRRDESRRLKRGSNERAS